MGSSGRCGAPGVSQEDDLDVMFRRRPRAARGTPRLVLRFTIFTTVALAIASIAMFVLVRGFVTTHAKEAVEQNTRFVVETVLANELQPSDFDRATLTPARREALRRLFLTRVMIDDVETVRLYDVHGRPALVISRNGIANSTAPSAIGFEFLGGKRIRTTIAHARAADGSRRQLLNQYVPISFGDQLAGALETSRDYAPIARSVRATFIPI